MSLDPASFQNWLQTLSQNNINYFLEGGQAVNLWANRFVSIAPELKAYIPFTSKDCDIWIDDLGLKRIDQILKGQLKKSSSPLDGQLGILKSQDNKLVLDLLSNVFGLTDNELKKAIHRRLEIVEIRVLDPLFLFKGKCHNFVNLPQSYRNDEKHLHMLGIIIPNYFKAFLKELQADEGEDPKLLKNEIKLLFSFEKDRFVKQAMEKLGITFHQLIPLDDLKKCDNPLIKKYVEGTMTPFLEKLSNSDLS